MSDKEFKPYVPADSTMREFTLRALLLGLVMCVVLGAANAYLGLRAGMTIAATYPAAVIGMAVLRHDEGLAPRGELRPDRRLDRRVGGGRARSSRSRPSSSSRCWSFQSFNARRSTSPRAPLMIVGGILGILFVTILRRVMVEDRSLPFPESVAAAEIHKAGQRGAGGRDAALQAMGVGALIKLARRRRRLPGLERRSTWRSARSRRASSASACKGDSATIAAGGVTHVPGPGRRARPTSASATSSGPSSAP